jgi:protein gp37
MMAGTKADPVEIFPQGDTGKARDKLGARVGLSGRTIDKIAAIVEQPDIAAKVEAGESSIEAGYKEARQRVKVAKSVPAEADKPKHSQETTRIVTASGEWSMIPLPNRVVFNQTNDSVDWAKWTWNPVTGCEHGCKFCYAREIANSERMRAYYPNGFEPTFHEYRLEAPANTTKPKSDDTRDGRVFVCSMADLFGTWVPQDWIQKVFAACIKSPDWEYLFLTKWPARYAKLPLIEGAWYGASVIQQADVQRVTAAMSKIDGRVVRWVSLEPMLGPIKFADLGWCDLMVIGSQTATNQPDGFVPAVAAKFDWVANVVRQCRDAGVPVYLKSNLVSSPGMDMPKEIPRGK